VAVGIGVSVGCAVGGEVAWGTTGTAVAATTTTGETTGVTAGGTVALTELTSGSGVSVTMIAPSGMNAAWLLRAPLPASELSTSAPVSPPITVYTATDA